MEETPFHADERQQPGAGITQSGRVRSGRGVESTSARLEGEYVGEEVRRISLVTSSMLMRRKGESKSKPEKSPEVERGGI